MKVELLSIMGSDETVCDAARVSFAKKASNYTDGQNEKLINFLAKNNHWSPFSHPQLQFRIEIPIYVERQLVKTEVGRVYNSISGRYVDFSDTYTLINDWRYQSKDSKQGSAGSLEDIKQKQSSIIEQNVIDYCKKAYDHLINLGVSKEQARTVLPLNLNTTQIWTGSLLSFIRLYKQRTKTDAQIETGDVVREMMDKLLETNKFNMALKAYGILSN